MKLQQVKLNKSSRLQALQHDISRQYLLAEQWWSDNKRGFRIKKTQNSEEDNQLDCLTAESTY